MQNSYPSLTRAIIYAGVALFSFFAASDYGPRPPAWVRFVLMGVALVTTAGALVEAVEWLLDFKLPDVMFSRPVKWQDVKE